MARNAPWNWNEKVVGADGKATPEFLAWLQQQLQANELANNAVPQSREIIAGVALNGGGNLSTDVTINHDDSAVTPGTYGDASNIPQIIVDQQGHVTSVTEIPVEIPAALEVEQDDVSVATDVAILNFTGAGVTATDAGGGQVDVAIPGSSSIYPAWEVAAVGTGSSQNITIPTSGLTEPEVLVFVNGLRFSVDEYTITGTTLTLTANASGDDIRIVGEITSTFSPPPSTPHPFWRILISESEGGANTGFAETTWRSAPGGSDEGAGGTMYASSILSSTYSADKGHDSNNSTFWISGGTLPPDEWLAISLLAAADIIQITITARNDGFYTDAPKEFSIQYSDDSTNGANGTWTTYWTETGITGWTNGQTRTFTKP